MSRRGRPGDSPGASRRGPPDVAPAAGGLGEVRAAGEPRPARRRSTIRLQGQTPSRNSPSGRCQAREVPADHRRLRLQRHDLAVGAAREEAPWKCTIVASGVIRGRAPRGARPAGRGRPPRRTSRRWGRSPPSASQTSRRIRKKQPMHHVDLALAVARPSRRRSSGLKTALPRKTSASPEARQNRLQSVMSAEDAASGSGCRRR